jgi:dipeptidyl aminopeptidase/acylaminoacyl peptidase
MSGSRTPREGAGPRSPRTPRGGPGIPLAAVLSVVGLLAIGFITWSIGTGDIAGLTGGTSNGGPGSTDDPTVQKTPSPPDVVVVPTAPPVEEVEPIPGTLVYVKDGNIWLQSDRTPQQLTKGGRDSMPTISPDGKTVYFVRTRESDGRWPVNGVVRRFALDVPALMSIPITGGKATRVMDGLVDPAGRLRWAGFIRNPAVSSNGRYIAIATDLPDPTRSDVVIKIWDTRRDRLIDPELSQVAPLGHQDPVWRPGTRKVVYARSDRDGAKGTPRLYEYDMETRKSRALTGPAYLHPSFSPDGRYIVATKQSPFGTDLVILSAGNGAELMRLTDDGTSWAPVWSPAGNQIAYLHASGQLVDLRLIQLEGQAPSWTVSEDIGLTENAGLDGASRPGWYVPEDQRPVVTPPPATPAPASPAASAAP